MSPGWLQEQCGNYLSEFDPADAAHDINHVKRVVKNVIYLTDIEGAKSLVTLASAWLHDCVAVAKDSPLKDALQDDLVTGDWIYEDMAAGYAKAEKTGKPLLVSFRCVP